MKNFTRTLFASLAVLPTTMFAQTVYSFDGTGNGSYNGTSYTNMVQYPEALALGTFGLTDASTLGLSFADLNTTKLFHGTGGIGSNSGSTVQAGSVDLTAIPSGTDQQVVWTFYLKTETTTPSKSGILLRAQSSSSGYSTEIRQGYYFVAQSMGTSGQIRFRIIKLSTDTGVSNLGDQTITVAGFTTGPLYLKAIALGTNLSLYYSLDNSSWVSAASATDATYASGTVQIGWGLGAGSNVSDVYFDNIIYTVPSSSSVGKAVADSRLHVVAEGNDVTVNSSSFSVYNLSGAKVNEVRSSLPSNTVTLKKGAYIVKSGKSVEKVIVK